MDVLGPSSEYGATPTPKFIPFKVVCEKCREEHEYFPPDLEKGIIDLPLGWRPHPGFLEAMRKAE